MKRQQLTRALADSIAKDAANDHMRRHGRKSWNEDDYNVAVREFNLLWPTDADIS